MARSPLKLAVQKNSVKQVEQYLKQYSARKPDMAVCVPGIDQIDQQDGKKRPLLMITVEQARQPPLSVSVSVPANSPCFPVLVARACPPRCSERLPSQKHC